MNIKDLMIGDWYKWNAEGKDYFYQVTAEDFTKDYVVNFEPIPLTPEILEKNGWKYDVFGWYDCDGIDFSVIISDGEGIGISVSNIDTAIVWIHYVHELQHALRLCGLNNLSENFKV